MVLSKDLDAFWIKDTLIIVPEYLFHWASQVSEVVQKLNEMDCA